MLLDSKPNLKFEAFKQNLNLKCKTYLTKTNMTQNNNL